MLTPKIHPFPWPNAKRPVAPPTLLDQKTVEPSTRELVSFYRSLARPPPTSSQPAVPALKETSSIWNFSMLHGGGIGKTWSSVFRYCPCCQVIVAASMSTCFTDTLDLPIELHFQKTSRQGFRSKTAHPRSTYKRPQHYLPLG